MQPRPHLKQAQSDEAVPTAADSLSPLRSYRISERDDSRSGTNDIGTSSADANEVDIGELMKAQSYRISDEVDLAEMSNDLDSTQIKKVPGAFSSQSAEGKMHHRVMDLTPGKGKMSKLQGIGGDQEFMSLHGTSSFDHGLSFATPLHWLRSKAVLSPISPSSLDEDAEYYHDQRCESQRENHDPSVRSASSTNPFAELVGQIVHIGKNAAPERDYGLGGGTKLSSRLPESETNPVSFLESKESATKGYDEIRNYGSVYADGNAKPSANLSRSGSGLSFEDRLRAVDIGAIQSGGLHGPLTPPAYSDEPVLSPAVPLGVPMSSGLGPAQLPSFRANVPREHRELTRAASDSTMVGRRQASSASLPQRPPGLLMSSFDSVHGKARADSNASFYSASPASQFSSGVPPAAMSAKQQYQHPSQAFNEQQLYQHYQLHVNSFPAHHGQQRSLGVTGPLPYSHVVKPPETGVDNMQAHHFIPTATGSRPLATKVVQSKSGKMDDQKLDGSYGSLHDREKLSVKQEEETAQGKAAYKDFSREFHNIEKNSPDTVYQFAEMALEQIPECSRWRVYVDVADFAKRQNNITAVWV
jgi:hypothetical protein